MVDETPLAPGQIHGFRAWGVSQEGVLCPVSQTSSASWHNGENMASCVRIVERSPVYPRPPVRPRHPDTVDPKELFAHGDVDTEARRRPVRAMRVREPAPYENDRTMPQLFPGDTMPVTRDIQLRWEEVRARALAEYARDMERFEKAQRLHEHEMEIFTRRNEEYMAEVEEHISPVEECECGFYMVRDRKDIQHDTISPTAFGVVRGYGRVVPYNKGWRFGKGRVVALMMLHGRRAPDAFYYLSDNAQEIVRRETQQQNDELVEKLKNNYPDAKFYDDEQDLMLDWMLVVSES